MKAVMNKLQVSKSRPKIWNTTRPAATATIIINTQLTNSLSGASSLWSTGGGEPLVLLSGFVILVA
jgi:hypothetical protein